MNQLVNVFKRHPFFNLKFKKKIKSRAVLLKVQHYTSLYFKELQKNEREKKVLEIKRKKALKSFKNGEIRVLVATDIAARGIDIDKLRYVLNYDIPNEPETYVHRIGRCGRAGEEGISISICEPEENTYVHDIEKLIKQKITVVQDHPFPQTDKPMNAQQKREFEQEKQNRKKEFFANRNKNRGTQNPGFRRNKRY